MFKHFILKLLVIPSFAISTPTFADDEYDLVLWGELALCYVPCNYPHAKIVGIAVEFYNGLVTIAEDSSNEAAKKAFVNLRFSNTPFDQIEKIMAGRLVDCRLLDYINQPEVDKTFWNENQPMKNSNEHIKILDGFGIENVAAACRVTYDEEKPLLSDREFTKITKDAIFIFGDPRTSGPDDGLLAKMYEWERQQSKRRPCARKNKTDNGTNLWNTPSLIDLADPCR